MTLLGREQVAKLLGLSARSVDRLRMFGKLKWIDVTAVKGNRPRVKFRLEDIEDFINRNRKGGESL